MSVAQFRTSRSDARPDRTADAVLWRKFGSRTALLDQEFQRHFEGCGCGHRSDADPASSIQLADPSGGAAGGAEELPSSALERIRDPAAIGGRTPRSTCIPPGERRRLGRSDGGVATALSSARRRSATGDTRRLSRSNRVASSQTRMPPMARSAQVCPWPAFNARDGSASCACWPRRFRRSTSHRSEWCGHRLTLDASDFWS